MSLELLPGHWLLYFLSPLYELALEFDDQSTSLDVVHHFRCCLWPFEICNGVWSLGMDGYECTRKATRIRTINHLLIYLKLRSTPISPVHHGF